MSFDISFEWVNVKPSSDEFAARTMARLMILVNGRVVTEVVEDDRSRRTKRDHVLVPMHHVAEWIVTYWHHLFYEVGDIAKQRDDFDVRHNLAFAGDGFILPFFTIAPVAGAMTLRWVPSRPRFSDVQFVSSGEARFSTEEVETKLRSVVEQVIARLRSENVPSDPLERNWDAINQLNRDEEEFVCASALLGIDPFDIEESASNVIIEFWQRTNPAVRADAVACADTFDSLPKIVAWLGRGFRSIENWRDQSFSAWNSLLNEIPEPNPSLPPWKRGYDLARSYHAVEQYHGQNGGAVPVKVPDIPTTVSYAPSKRFQGLVDAESPACVITSRGERAKRFLHARALGAFCASPRRHPTPSLLSTLATDFQAVTRAFAAELLAPAHLLRGRIGSRGMGSDKSLVRELANEFLVSDAVIMHQVENHQLN